MPIASRTTGRDEREALLPLEIRPLFDDGFVHSCDLYEEYVGRLAARVARDAGIAEACATPATVDDAIARAGLDPAAAQIPVAWTLAVLAARGAFRVAASPDGPRYAAATMAAEDPEEMRAAQERHDPRALPSYAIAALAASQYPAVLRGETSGEAALFSAERLAAWADYFSNENTLYAVSNTIGAIAAARALAEEPGGVLELGGGLGSAALALRDRLAATGSAEAVSAYRFSELSIPFLRRAQRSLGDRFGPAPIAFARLDMDRPFAAGGVERESYALVWAVNALHVAKDLAFTLGEIRDALRPGGTLVVAECVRPFAARPVYLEFVFNLLEGFRSPVLVPGWRPNGGFLTPEQWTGALAANGFGDVRWLPDVATIRDAYPSFVVSAGGARRM